MNKFFLFVILLVSLTYLVQAQPADTTSVLINRHSPKRAANMSALVPGLGQVYNKQYYKVPIIYAGGAALVYSIVWNNREYNKFLDAYKRDSDTSSSNNSQYFGIYSTANLIVLKDYYRRNRDLSAIVLVLLYTANIVDAYVYAHFYNFDVSDDLSMKVKPFVAPGFHVNNTYMPPVTGVSLTLNFKARKQAGLLR